MAMKFIVLFACLLGSTVTALPVGDEDVQTQNYQYSEHHLSGASGTFSYPLSGSSYGHNERVTITAEFPANTLFIIEDYDIESSSTCGYDKLSLRHWQGTTADDSFCGSSTAPKYYRTERSFFLTFATDSTVSGSGFNLRWVPFEPLAV